MIEQFELARNERERASIAFSRNFAEAFAEGRFEECERLLGEAMELADDRLRVDLLVYLSRVYEATGRVEEARDAAARAEAQRALVADRP